MISITRQTIASAKYWLHMIIPSLTMFIFVGFAFLMASMIVLSVIPIYLENKSVEKTRFILTTVTINNYVLYMNRSIGKRDLTRAIASSSNTTGTLTLGQAQMTMNLSIQYALGQQLQAGDNRDSFNIYLLQMIPYTTDPSNMSVALDLFIVYNRECLSCDKHRQSIIFQQLCSNSLLSTPIRFLIQYTNLSYVLSNPIYVYTPYIPIGNITVITQIVSSTLTNNTDINGQIQLSNELLANNYTLTITTTKTNYFATLNTVVSQTSANQNDGPVPLLGAVTMYSPLAQIIERQTQLPNGSNALNITINRIVLQFWYSNSTIHAIVDFSIYFSTSCNQQCMNQRSNQLAYQLGNLTNTQIQIQPANLTDGQVYIVTNGVNTLFDYSLTPQVITNFSGTIIYAIPPTLTILY